MALVNSINLSQIIRKKGRVFFFCDGVLERFVSWMMYLKRLNILVIMKVFIFWCTILDIWIVILEVLSILRVLSSLWDDLRFFTIKKGLLKVRSDASLFFGNLWLEGEKTNQIGAVVKLKFFSIFSDVSLTVK